MIGWDENERDLVETNLLHELVRLARPVRKVFGRLELSIAADKKRLRLMCTTRGQINNATKQDILTMVFDLFYISHLSCIILLVV